MTTTTQQIPPDPARDFANAILAETNNARDLIELLHEISLGNYDANQNDRIAATNTLMDRGLGKCPKQTPAGDDGQTPDPLPQSDNIDDEAIRESQPAVTHEGPESPRLVSQLDDSLNQSLGPPPSPCPEPAEGTHTPSAHSPGEPDPYSMQDGSPGPFDPFSIQSSIQEYILTITNNGQTLRATLMEIAFADPEDASVIPSHRRRAATLLVDRALGTDPSRVLNGVCPDCRRKWTTHPGSHDHPEPSGVMDETEEEPFDREVWEEIIAELNQMEEQGIITPDPDAPEVDMSAYMKWTDEEIAPYAAEAAAKLWNDIELRLERQKQWPEIEERRRKKLAQIYPSHTDSKSPDT